MIAKNFVYIEIEEQNIFLSILKIQKNSFDFKDTKKIILDNFTIIDGKIFNPTKIYNEIKSYINSTKTNIKKTIVVFNKLENKNFLEQKLVTFQISLLISKAELFIENILSKSLADKNLQKDFLISNIRKQLDFFTPFKPKRNIKNIWLTIIFFLLLTLSISFISILQINKIKQIKNLDRKILISQELNKDLLSKNKDFIKLKIENNNLKIKSLKIEKSLKNQNNPEKLLSSIAENIPEYTWLNSVKFNFEKNKSIEIEGTTIDQKFINIYFNRLLQDKGLKNIKIERIEKSKINKNKKLELPKDLIFYDFKFSGKI